MKSGPQWPSVASVHNALIRTPSDSDGTPLAGNNLASAGAVSLAVLLAESRSLTAVSLAGGPLGIPRMGVVGMGPRTLEGDGTACLYRSFLLLEAETRSSTPSTRGGGRIFSHLHFEKFLPSIGMGGG